MKTIQPLITHEKSRWGSGGKVKDQTKNDMRVTSTKRKALKLYGNRRSRRYEPQFHCGASHRTVLAYYCHAIAVCRNCLVPSLGYSSFKSSQVKTEWCRKDPRIPQTRSFKPFLQVRSPALNKWTPTPPAVQALSRSAAPR